MASNKHIRKAHQHYGKLKIANERGVFAVRRKIDPVSFETLGKALGRLTKNIDGIEGDVTQMENLSTTIVGFSRFTDRLIRKGPPTNEIINTDSVPSIRKPIEAKMGKLGLFGSEIGRRKLGVVLHSPQLWNEIKMCESAYQKTRYGRERFPLKADPKAINGIIVPHCSLAFLFAESSLDFEANNSRRMRHLDGTLGLRGQTIQFQPVQLKHIDPIN